MALIHMMTAQYAPAGAAASKRQLSIIQAATKTPPEQSAPGAVSASHSSSLAGTPKRKRGQGAQTPEQHAADHALLQSKCAAAHETEEHVDSDVPKDALPTAAQPGTSPAEGAKTAGNSAKGGRKRVKDRTAPQLLKGLRVLVASHTNVAVDRMLQGG